MAKTPKQKLDLLGHKHRLVFSKNTKRASKRVSMSKRKARRSQWYPRTITGKAAAATVTNASIACGYMLAHSSLTPNITYKNPALQEVFNGSLQRYLNSHTIPQA